MLDCSGTEASPDPGITMQMPCVKGNSKMSLLILHSLFKHIKLLAPLCDVVCAVEKTPNWALILHNNSESLTENIMDGSLWRGSFLQLLVND